jgi:hypothetical protein
MTVSVFALVIAFPSGVPAGRSASFNREKRPETRVTMSADNAANNKGAVFGHAVFIAAGFTLAKPSLSRASCRYD